MKLLDIDDLCKILKCRKSFIYRAIYEGKIPGVVRLGHRTLRFDEAEILRWIEELSENGGEKLEATQQKFGSIHKMGRTNL